MNIHNFIPATHIINNIYRDFPFERDISLDSVVSWMGEALELIGAPGLFREFITDGNDLPIVEITNNRGILPCQIVHLQSVYRKNGSNLTPMITSSDSAFISDSQKKYGGSFTYKITNNHIHTSFEKGEVVIKGTTINVDEEGFPMIPDNVKIIKAVTAYVMERIGFKLLMLGKIDGGRYSILQQEVGWYMGAADSAARMPNYDEMQSWVNITNKLLLDKDFHNTRFNRQNNLEKIRRSSERS